MKERMERFIKQHYPDAVLDSYSKTVWGEEYLFYPTPQAEYWYCCVVKDGELVILTDF